MTDQLNSQTPGPDAPDRYDRILHAVGSTFDSLGAWPDHPRALETLADTMEQLIDTEVEASQRRAIRIQTLLDDTRDRMRKLANELIEHGCPWTGSSPEAGRRILAALEPPKET